MSKVHLPPSDPSLPAEECPVLSVVTPAFNESENLPPMYRRLCEVLDATGVPWEWVIVDDHSADDTFKVASLLASEDPRVRGLRLARNSGAHTASVCGLAHASGQCAVLMASDLQDPPEVIPQLVERWRAGAQVVWAVRAHREGERASTVGLSRLYYLIMRRLVGFTDMPATGADFLLVDSLVLDALRRFNERNVSILALISWMGFRQDSLTYDKQPRLHGRSGWSLGKKIKLAVDSVTSFSYLPIRLMSFAGFAVAILGFAYAAHIIYNAFTGTPVEGWSSLMVVVLVVGGVQMLMMGVLGEYLWRTLDEARGRPFYLVEAATSAQREGERTR